MKKFLSVLLALLLVASLVPLSVLATSAPVPVDPTVTDKYDGRIYFYYESFARDTALEGAAAVLDAFGWTTPNATAHNANVTATEGGDDYIPLFEVRGEKLYIRNRGTATETVVLSDSARLADALGGAFTLEYALTYLPTTASTADGYFTVLYAGNAAMTTYGMAPVRVSGWGNNLTVVNGTQTDTDGGDLSVSGTALTGMNAYLVTNDVNPTLYERVFGNVDVVPGTGNGSSLKGSRVLVNKELRIRMEFNGATAPAVYVNDVQVSDPSQSLGSEALYRALLGAGGSQLGFAVSAGVDCVVDDIAVYVDTAAEERVELGDLYITEVAPLPTNANAPYIEIYNAGNSAVDLADYTVGWYVVRSASESLVSFALGDYIGKTLNFETLPAIENLSAADAVLAAGETVLIFPVGADAATLVATEGGVTLAGFRAAYDLGADAKILAVPAGECTYTDANGQGTVLPKRAIVMEPTARCRYFVGATADAQGEEIRWARIASADLANEDAVESVVELVPSIAFGYAADGADFALDANGKPIFDFGRDGDTKQGYAAHYLYGVDRSLGDKGGILLDRCAALGAGELLAVQQTYFQKIAAYRAGNYKSDGGLVITEYIPVTANDLYDAFELTNNGAAALDLYGYGLVGGIDGVWASGSVLAVAPTLAISDFTGNPADLSAMAAGASVVVWNVTQAVLDAGATVADFRAYHNLDSAVTVVLLDSTAANALTVPNNGLCSFAVSDNVAAFLADTAELNVVSDVIVPLNTLSYELDGLHRYTPEDLLKAAPDVFGILLGQYGGKLYTTSFLFGMIEVAVNEGDSVAGYYTAEQVTEPYAYTRYTACASDATSDGVTKYYRYAARKGYESFCFYGCLANTAVPNGAVFTFAYGEMAVDSKTTGALMQSLLVEDYQRTAPKTDSASMVPYLIATNGIAEGFLVTKVAHQGYTTTHTLGETVAYQGIVAAINEDNYYKLTYKDAEGNTVCETSFAEGNSFGYYIVLDDTVASWNVTTAAGTAAYQAGDRVLITGETTVSPAAAPVA